MFIKQKKAFSILLLILFIIINDPSASFALMLPSQNAYSPPSPWALDTVLEAAFNDISCYENDSTGNKYKTSTNRSGFNPLIFNFCQKALKKDLWVADYSSSDHTVVDNCLYSLGIIKDLSADTLNRPLSRQEAAVILVRALKVAGVDTSINNLNDFEDDQQISEWAKESINFCYNNGIMHGIGNNKIGPLAPLTYEQAIALIHHAGFMYGFFDKPPLYENTEIIAAESLPSVSTRVELAKYFSRDNAELSSYFPDSVYRVAGFNKGIYIAESSNTNISAPTYSELPSLYDDKKKWCVIYDLFYDQEKYTLNCYQRGNDNNEISKVWFFMKDGSFEYAVDPFSFNYIGKNFLCLGHTLPLRLAPGHTNLVELIPLSSGYFGTMPYYKELSYENVEKIVVQCWDKFFLCYEHDNE